MSTKHTKAAAKFLQNTERAKWYNQAIWSLRQKRDKQSHSVPEWEDLRQAACDTKLYTNSHLADFLEEFERHAKENGAIVHWAKDDKEYCEIIYGILKDHHVKNFMKSKSMLAEECHLNPYLLERGIDVVESDLGERILQLMHLPPSHIVMPAVHVKREEICEVFAKEIGSDAKNSDPTYLTHAMRSALRKRFVHEDAAMTGANFAVASTGEVVVCTNEGNADMGASMSKLQICAFGMEKIVPNRESLGIFTRLLARSGTGQPITAYTSHYSHPQKGGEFHIIIVDNGRSEILKHPERVKLLNCLRCGACMNTCPVYRRSGGYSYTYFIPGPIGINLGMMKDEHKYHDNVSACSLCYSCSCVCPAKVDLAENIYRWRQDLDRIGAADPIKKGMSKGMNFLMERPALFHLAMDMGWLANHAPKALVNNPKLNAWGIYHDMPEFAKESFNTLWKKGKVK